MASSRSAVCRLVILGMFVATSNCTDELPTQPSPLIVAAGGRSDVLSIVSGNNQTGPVATALAAPLLVRLTHNGKGVKGASIVFSVASGGGQVSPPTTMTDAQGRASTTWTLGTVVGPGSVSASAATAGPVTFAAQAVAGPPAQFTIVSGNNQTGVAGAALANPLVVRVSDAYGNRVSNAQVQFAVTGGSGSLGTPTVVTDTGGVARTTWTLGTAAGSNTARATVGSLSPLVFTATGTAGAAVRFTIVSGDAQSAPVGTVVPAALVVRVADANNNPVAGATVTFAVTSGGGSVDTPAATTDAGGRAQTRWTLGAQAGANSASASIAALPSLTFSATGIPGAPAHLVIVSGDAQSAVAGGALAQPIVAQVNDANNNPLAGVTVAFAVTAGGGSVAAPSVTTGADGQASTTWTLGLTAGPNQVTASAASIPSVVFTATATAPPAVTVTTVGGDNQTGVVGTRLPLPLVVLVSGPPSDPKDPRSGPPVAGLIVQFSVIQGGGSVSPSSAVTDAQGHASTMLTLGPNSGTNEVQVRVPGGTSTTSFLANGQPPGPFAILAASGNNQTALPGATLAPLVAQVVDANSVGISGLTVTFSVVQGGGTLSVMSAVTDAQGLAQTTYTLGSSAGPNKVQASAAALTPFVFSELALPQLTIVSGDNQTGGVGQPLPNPIVVQLTGAGSGIPLVFSVVAGGGSVAHPSVMTDATGTAQVSWTLGTTAGPNAVQVAVQNIPQISPVTLHATGETIGAPARLAIVAGNNQTGAAGFPLPDPLVVQVQDAQGVGVPDITVTFTAPAGSGSVSNTTVTSDGTGHAQTFWTLGTTPGPNSVEAASSGLSPVTFTATGVTPLTLVIFGGDQQVGIIGTPLPQPLAVQALQRPIDPRSPPGPPVSGVTISFTVAVDGILSSATAVTGSDGVASVSLTLGNASGKIIVQASTPAADGPASFTETAVLPGPATLLAVSGNFQSGTIGTQLSQQLQVRVADGTGAPVSGVAVTFTPGPSSGSVDAPNAVTGVDGTASIHWTLGGVLQETLNASVTGLPTVPFAALGAPRLAIYSGDQQTGAVGAPLPQPAVVRLTDLNGQPVPGVPVTFAVTGGGGSVTQTQATSTSAGLAQATWTLGTTAGANALVARYPNPPAPFAPFPASVAFTATGVVAGPPANLVIFSGNGQTGGTGATLPAPLEVQVVDASGIGVGGVTVDFAAYDGGSAAPNTTTSGFSGKASTSWTLGPGVGSQTLTARASGLPTATFTASAIAPAALLLRSRDDQQVPVGISITFDVLVQDANGAGMPGMPVTYSVVSGAGTFDPVLVRTGSSGEASTNVTLPTTAGTEVYQADVPGLAPVRMTVQVVAGPAANLEIVSGDGQTAPYGTTLPQPIVVRVTDAFGNPIAGIPVTFKAAPGSGSVSAPDPTTDATGSAGVEWTLGPAPGQQTVTALAPRVNDVTFNATAVAGPPVALSIASGDHQRGNIGRPLDQPLTVVVADANGYGVSGQTVSFAVTGGDGTLSQSVVVTNTQGAASTSWTLGPTVSAQSVEASSGALTLVVFTASAVAPTLQLISGENLTVQSGQPTTVTVRATDLKNLPWSDLSITFRVVTGGGSVSDATVQTDLSGSASTTWTIGAIGLNQLGYSAPGTVTYIVEATGVAGPPAQVVIISGDAQNTQLGTTIAQPVVAQVSDAYGNHLPGIQVQALPSSGGSVFAAPAITDASGRVSFAWTLGRSPGSQTLSLSVTGAPPAAVSASADPLTGPAIALLLGNNQVAPSGTALPAQIAVQVLDAAGAPVVGASVSFSVVQGGGTVLATPVPTDGSGIARTNWALGPFPGSNTVSAAVTGLRTVYFNARGT